MTNEELDMCEEYAERGLICYVAPGKPVFITDLISAAREANSLRHELKGEAKARELLMKGMESQCEEMDRLKQEVRTLRAESEEWKKIAKEELESDKKEISALFKGAAELLKEKE